MQIIPTTCPNSTSSSAERKIFKSLQNTDLRETAVCFHSLRLSEHQYKREGELDFVLLTPQGLFVLEIKGGNVRRDDTGSWHFTDRYGASRRKHEGPFDQASSGVHSLIKLIKDHFGNSRISDVAYGYGVIFPDCNFNIRSPEWSPEMILDASCYKTGGSISPFLYGLIKYWRSKGLNSKAPVLEPKEIQQLRQYLRPKFDMASTLAHRAEELELEMATLTQEQYDKLDGMQLNERILCSGGAGTGKTFLALEVARRHTEENKSVLMVCRSPVLAAFLNTRAGRGVTVRSVENLMHVDVHDVLVVDEGQDVLDIDNLSMLEKHLKGGIEKGCWRIFYDKNNQSGIYGSFDPEALELLKSFHPALYELQRNCRNTQHIVTQTRMLTASDIGKPSAGDGPYVIYSYNSDQEQCVRALEEELKKLLDDDVSFGDITILSPLEFSDSIVSKLPVKYLRKLVEISSHNSAFFPGTDLTFSTVKNFKGLENKFIFLIDIDATQIESLSTLYVAMTRAKVGLTFILREKVRKHIEKLLIQNIHLAGA